MSVSVALVKQHLNIDHDADNALLQVYIDAAEGWIAAQIGKPLADFDSIPAEITLATLQLAGAWYESREAVVFGGAGAEIPFGVRDLIRPHREWEI